jgi:hypothetical protein
MCAPGTFIACVDPLRDPHWDARVARFPGASFFHSRAWLQVLRDSYGLKPCFFRADDNEGRPAVLVPFVEINSWLTGRRGVSLPFTDECQPLYTESDTLRETIEAIGAYGRYRRWKYWEIRGGAATIQAPAATSFYAHRTNLDSDVGRLLGRCDSAARRAVRKSEQSDLTISFSYDLESTRQFHALLCTTRKRHGLPPQPFSFFGNIQRHVLAARKGCIVLARIGDVPVAGAMFFQFGRVAIFKYGASNQAFQHLRPNNLVMWRAMEYYARAGFEALDFGRTSLGNEGLRHFKLSWAATERVLDYVRFNYRTASFVKARDRSSGWYSGLFKLLPVALARLVGATAYRHVA